MAKKRIKDTLDFSEETVKKKRKFPLWRTVLLIVLVLTQAGLITAAVLIEEFPPQDIIRSYEVTVEPRRDGTLDMIYSFVWDVMDEDEPLEEIDIGLANDDYTLYSFDSPTGAVKEATSYNDGDGMIGLRFELVREYFGGERIEFSFKINQRSMLCRDGEEYFYEWIPGWFNYTPVESYTMRWRIDEGLHTANYDRMEDGYLIWEGKMDCGTYLCLQTKYDGTAFSDGARIVAYKEFNGAGVEDGPFGTMVAMKVFCSLGAALLIIAEVFIVDCHVSYHRGRGFIKGYGHPMYVYGYSNPHYVRAREKEAAKGGRGGGFGGGGCACACACACAGGGRAGCSQKDTTPPEKLFRVKR